MKYRHYAPKADLAIVEGPDERVIAEIEKRALEAEKNGDTVGIIATDETKDRYSHGIIKVLEAENRKKPSHIIFMRCCVILTAVM